MFLIGKSDGKGTVGRKNFNRFTTFVKSGGESYILGTVKVAFREEDKVYIYVSRTVQSDNSYAC
jgi:sorting nexin-9/18/33